MISFAFWALLPNGLWYPQELQGVWWGDKQGADQRKRREKRGDQGGRDDNVLRHSAAATLIPSLSRKKVANDQVKDAPWQGATSKRQ